MQLVTLVEANAIDLKAQIILAFLAKSIFKLCYVYCFLKHATNAHLIDFNIVKI